jgi:hypothetical protein
MNILTAGWDKTGSNALHVSAELPQKLLVAQFGVL